MLLHVSVIAHFLVFKYKQSDTSKYISVKTAFQYIFLWKQHFNIELLGKGDSDIWFRIQNWPNQFKAAWSFLLICLSLNSAGWGIKKAEEVQNQLNQAGSGQAPTQAARPQTTGCAAAGYTGCCTGDNCKTDSGCYCDVRCYYFHNCCDDITSIGCYRKCKMAVCVHNS